jgi:hypothetical protein
MLLRQADGTLDLRKTGIAAAEPKENTRKSAQSGNLTHYSQSFTRKGTQKCTLKSSKTTKHFKYLETVTV